MGKKKAHIPSLILRLIKNLRENSQDSQRQFQNRRQLRPFPADRQAQLVDGQVDRLGCVLRVARLLEDEKAA